MVGLMLLVREVRQVPPSPTVEPGKGEIAPLTDVAPASRRSVPEATPVAPRRSPRPESMRPAQPADASRSAQALPTVVVPPSLMPDPANPPQWTKERAVPGEPTPPDPFVPPEIEQDPERGRTGGD